MDSFHSISFHFIWWLSPLTVFLWNYRKNFSSKILCFISFSKVTNFIPNRSICICESKIRHFGFSFLYIVIKRLSFIENTNRYVNTPLSRLMNEKRDLCDSFFFFKEAYHNFDQRDRSNYEFITNIVVCRGRKRKPIHKIDKELILNWMKKETN